MKTVFFDVDTQLDFVSPSGSLYVPGAERIVPVITRLNRHASGRGIPVISTADAHAEDDPEFRQWPHHCVAGTLGQRKPESTLLDGRVVVPNREHPLQLEGARQIILEKQTLNAFDVPNLARALYHLAADRYFVYGVVTEICVHLTVRGLLKLAKPVAIAADAIAGLDPEKTSQSLSEMQASGAQLLTSAEICGA